MNQRSFAKLVASGAAAVACAGPVQAQQHADLLRQVLEESARGNCPESLMSPMLRGACQSQMPNMKNVLASKGAITKTEFMGMQASAMGPAEVYKVTFASGTMLSLIHI